MVLASTPVGPAGNGLRRGFPFSGSAAGEWDLRFGDNAVVGGWERLSRHAPGRSRTAGTIARATEDLSMIGQRTNA